VYWNHIWHDLTDLGIPVSDKALRTFFVYGGLVVLLRLAGKRMLSQLNTFDLVVVLLLSNVVQNAIIGPDNSLLGGLIGACFLVAMNAIWERVATSSKVLQGSPTTLVRDGVADKSAIERVGLRLPEVMAALHRQGADRVEDVEVAMLEPGGAIRMELTPDARGATYGELRRAVDELRTHLDERMSALDASLAASLRPASSPPAAPPAQ
jgi:uncharacterized membrane protein YcaP (DUF421 family)